MKVTIPSSVDLSRHVLLIHPAGCPPDVVNELAWPWVCQQKPFSIFDGGGNPSLLLGCQSLFRSLPKPRPHQLAFNFDRAEVLHFNPCSPPAGHDLASFRYALEQVITEAAEREATPLPYPQGLTPSDAVPMLLNQLGASNSYYGYALLADRTVAIGEMLPCLNAIWARLPSHPGATLCGLLLFYSFTLAATYRPSNELHLVLVNSLDRFISISALALLPRLTASNYGVVLTITFDQLARLAKLNLNAFSRLPGVFDTIMAFPPAVREDDQYGVWPTVRTWRTA